MATTGTATIAKTVPDTPLSSEGHSVYRTALGVKWANQEVFGDGQVFEPSEKAEPMIVFRRTKVEAMRRWTAEGSGGNSRMKQANCFNRNH